MKSVNHNTINQVKEKTPFNFSLTQLFNMRTSFFQYFSRTERKEETEIESHRRSFHEAEDEFSICSISANNFINYS